MDPRRRRCRHRRHLQPRAGGVGRHRLRRSPGDGADADQGPGSRGGRIGEGGLGRLCAGRRRGRRGQCGGRRRSGADQPRPRRRGLVLQVEARRSRRGRRADGRSGLSRVGDDALISPPALMDPGASTSKWDAGDYARVAGFVPALGAAALDLLNPQPGERILDVGCGDGALSLKIIELGAEVVGVDSSPDLVEAARAAGVYAELMDAADMGFERQFDAAFSNAALHWMLDKERVAAAVFAALHFGGRFAGEMGGEGNIAILRGGIRAELEDRGYPVPAEDPQWYPSVAEFRAVYEAA